MKEKIKNISFPALLLLITCVSLIRSVFSNLFSFLGGFISISSVLALLKTLAPFVLFYFLFAKPEKKKSVGIASIFFGCATILRGIFNIRSLFTFGSFIDIVVYGPLYNVISDILIGLLLLLLGWKLIHDKNVTTGYYFLCGLSIFLIAYASTFMAIANPLAIISKLPTFFYVLSLWYIPKVYIESEQHKIRITSKKIKIIVIVVVIMYVFLAVAGGLSGTTSSSANAPWRDLGVTKKEYMDVYNYYKYGVR